MAKAPVAGRVKTRLGAETGMDFAAELAAAALLDTLDACRLAFEDCHLALDGNLSEAVRGAEITAALTGWEVFAQIGDTFGERLAHAHLAAAHPGTVVVQIGMDTPQVTSEMLRGAAAAVTRPDDAALGPAEDGGWWVLAIADGARAGILADVPMSVPETCAATEKALTQTGCRVQPVAALRDVDTVADAGAVAAAAPQTRFGHTWAGRPVAVHA